MRVFFIFISLILFVNINFAQNSIERYYNKNLDTLQLIKYYTSVGNKADFIMEFELQSIIALVNYPELKDVVIIFKYDKIETTMSCKPNTTSLFGERVYEITINNDTISSAPLLKDVPFNAQIGIIAHEYAHIVDYEEKNIFGLVSTGIEYLNENSRDDFEKGIDKITINHGYGWQLFEWAEFVQNSNIIAEDYKKYKRTYYLSGADIKAIMNTLDIYNER